MEYRKSRRISLKAHPSFTEKWLQQQILADPSVLGSNFADLVVKDVERSQPRAGRLDVLLQDPETATRYEVEIQLGATDESHIIRTIEYWDNEKRRYPQYEHIAVIVAEDITSRFLNVINLFNRSIPLIAVQMNALEVDGLMTLNATKVLDLALPELEEDDVADEEADRAYWVSKGGDSVVLADTMLAQISEYVSGLALKYNKHYIGLQRDGLSDNFVTFRPRRKHLRAEFRIERSEELSARLEDTGLDMLPYDKRWGRYRLQLQKEDLSLHRELLGDLIRMSAGLPSREAATDAE